MGPRIPVNVLEVQPNFIASNTIFLVNLIIYLYVYCKSMLVAYSEKHAIWQKH